MVNEFVYCPRLFYLEWVEARFASSDDIEEGLYVHRVVDEPGGRIISPDQLADGTETRRSRAVWVPSRKLGVSAKIDMVESDGEHGVVPVDYKKGHPNPHGEPWQSDWVQSVLQALILRDVGYPVQHAEIWYHEVRQRVLITVDEEAELSTRRVVADLWEVARGGNAPPPLVDSPKCARCSLVGICLPDEINTLNDRVEGRLRPSRIVPSRPDPQPLYIQEQGAVVGVDGNRLYVRGKGGDRLDDARLIDVSQLCLQGNVSVTSQAMRQLFAREIPVCWFTYGGWFSGLAHGLPSKNVDVRRAQYTVSPNHCLRVAKKLVEGKIRNSRTLLRRNSRVEVAPEIESLAGLVRRTTEANSFPTLLGIEGAAARIYFSRFTQMLADETNVPITQFDDHGRSRRPPPDPVNALLSFTYALLVKDFTVVLNAIGLDPYLGVYHRPRFGRPALALDMAEEFRPLVAESVVLQVINNGEVTKRDFTTRAGGCQLEREGRKLFFELTSDGWPTR